LSRLPPMTFGTESVVCVRKPVKLMLPSTRSLLCGVAVPTPMLPPADSVTIESPSVPEGPSVHLGSLPVVLVTCPSSPSCAATVIAAGPAAEGREARALARSCDRDGDIGRLRLRRGPSLFLRDGDGAGEEYKPETAAQALPGEHDVESPSGRKSGPSFMNCQAKHNTGESETADANNVCAPLRSSTRALSPRAAHAGCRERMGWRAGGVGCRLAKVRPVS
jgi:hypothetical protein